jgi:hypothetical protein
VSPQQQYVSIFSLSLSRTHVLMGIARMFSPLRAATHTARHDDMMSGRTTTATPCSEFENGIHLVEYAKEAIKPKKPRMRAAPDTQRREGSHRTPESRAAEPSPASIVSTYSRGVVAVRQ